MYKKLLVIALFFLIITLPNFASAATATSFRVAPGFVDNVPRQIVRADNNKVYLFASVIQTPGILKAYWNPAGGFPDSATDFSGTTQVNNGSQMVSAEVVYGGGEIIHVFINDMTGNIKDYPFDTSTNTFKTAISVATGAGKPGSYTDIGTAGVSGMFDKSDTLHFSYWTSTNQIMYLSMTYNSSTNILNVTSGPTRLDSSGNANHPQIVVSPVDNSVTVAWVNGINGAGTMSAKTRSPAGVWGNMEAVSTGAVWTSPNAGINIDQGPSMVITPDGVRNLIYIENFDGTGDYGKLHYVKNSGSGWVDTAVSQFYTHAPAIATNILSELYVLGHGHPNNPSCKSMLDVCFVKQNSNGSWTNPTLFIAHPGSDSLDASVSVKWGVAGWNAPETIEFVFFSANNGSYQNTDLWYGRLASVVSSSPSPAISPSPSPSTTKPGDVDGNNKVDIFDYNILLTNFGKTGIGIAGDVDLNGKVDIFDYNILLTNFGK